MVKVVISDEEKKARREKAEALIKQYRTKPPEQIKPFHESVHGVAGHSQSESDKIRDSLSKLSYYATRSLDNGWKNVSIPYADLQEHIEHVKRSLNIRDECFEGMKAAAVLADKNLKIAKTLYAHPIEKVFEKFVRGEITVDELQAEIKKEFDIKDFIK